MAWTEQIGLMTSILSRSDPVFLTACLKCSFLAYYRRCLKVSSIVKSIQKVLGIRVYLSRYGHGEKTEKV